MIDAVADLIEAGRAKLYMRRLLRRGVVVEPVDRARGRAPAPTTRYEAWIVERVVPVHPRRPVGARRRSSTPGAASAPTTPRTSRCAAPTCSRSRCACRAATTPRTGTAGAIAATRPTSTARSTTSSTSAATTSTGCARGVSLLLVCGQGQWEDTTGALDSTPRARRAACERKGIRHELDLWGHDVPHDWPSWRAQIAHHLPRFC